MSETRLKSDTETYRTSRNVRRKLYKVKSSQGYLIIINYVRTTFSAGTNGTRTLKTSRSVIGAYTIRRNVRGMLRTG
jgi:hypothetical protein